MVQTLRMLRLVAFDVFKLYHFTYTFFRIQTLRTPPGILIFANNSCLYDTNSLPNKQTPNIKARHWASTSHPHRFYLYCPSKLLSPSSGGYRNNFHTKIRYAFVTPVYELHDHVVVGFIPSWVYRIQLSQSSFLQVFIFHISVSHSELHMFFHLFSSSPSSPCNAVVTR
jgi:hypothetical protein